MIVIGVVSIAFGVLMLVASGMFSTRYAPGYSESAFKRIRVGMGTNEVLQIVGKPLGEYFIDAEESWYWSYTEYASVSFPIFKMRMSRVTNGVVAEISRCTVTR